MSFNIFFNIKKILFIFFLVVFGPFALAIFLHGANTWDFTIPFVYGMNDSMFQMVLAKSVIENGWVFINPYLGAPGIADWHYHAGGQTSALHSLIMILMSFFSDNAIAIVNYYYFINFSFISLTTFIVFRVLKVNFWLSVSAGYIYSFLVIRLLAGFDYIFLSSYFMVPLIILVTIWSIMGKYTENTSNIREIIFSKYFLSSLLIIFFLSISDGYFSFFSVLLLTFASFVTIINYQTRKLSNFFIPMIFSFLILSIVTTLMYPLNDYKKHHPNEFQTILKQPFEAEVYSTSLKLMLSPQPLHHSKFMANMGQQIVATNNEARKFPSSLGWANLGILGTVFLLFMFGFLFMHGNQKIDEKDNMYKINMIKMVSSLGLFSFLCAIYGGIGTLIALVYPTIRAYDRFGIFLFFYIMLSTYLYLTIKLKNYKINLFIQFFIIFTITAIALWDQVPKYIHRTMNGSTQVRFIAEKKLITKLESEVPKNSMIYNYPYSQYVDDGIAGNMRAYFHSKTLRWSNGASKNTQADLWNKDLAQSSIEDIVRDLPLFGFNSILIDKLILSEKDYLKIKKAIEKKYHLPIQEDNIAQMAYFIFPKSNVKVIFNQQTLYPTKLIIYNINKIDYSILPRWIHVENLMKYVSTVTSAECSIDLNVNKNILNKAILDGNNISFNLSLDKEKLLGNINIHSMENLTNRSIITLEIKNESDYDWKLNSGTLPFTIGFHLFDSDHRTILFDNGFRLKTSLVIPKLSNALLKVDMNELNLQNYCQDHCKLGFELLQEGNAWFSINQENKYSKIDITINK